MHKGPEFLALGTWHLALGTEEFLHVFANRCSRYYNINFNVRVARITELIGKLAFSMLKTECTSNSFIVILRVINQISKFCDFGASVESMTHFQIVLYRNKLTS